MALPANAQQEKMCKAYLKHHNAKDAALEAGYTETYALKKASVLVNKLMPYIHTLVQTKTAEMIRLGVMEDREVLEGISNIARANWIDFVKIDVVSSGKKRILAPTLKPINELTREQADAIDKVWYEGGKLMYSLHDKKHARELLGKHYGHWNDKLISMRITATMNNKADLRDVPTNALIEAEAILIEKLGPVAKRLLGYKPEDEREVIEHEG